MDKEKLSFALLFATLGTLVVAIIVFVITNLFIMFGPVAVFILSVAAIVFVGLTIIFYRKGI